MNLGEGIRKALAKITGKAIVDESAIKSMIKDIQRALIISDVNIELVYKLSKQIENRALNEKPIAGRSVSEHVHAIVYEELTKIMGEGRKLELKPQRIMVCGLFGSGKTTQIGKIAYYLKQRGMSVGVIAADMMRPAAYEQLEQISKQVGCNFYGRKGAKASEVVREGLEKLKNEIIIIDTSGRDALDDELIAELKEINEVAKPDE
ncbi:MAG: signal recognition particle receptor subunit alpha, partial [Candidatus Micrarchaeota archaeon]|nr:signal recognition particle receptor subunit alpha [Candidatus Micrarchaeota archaeon]